MHDINFIRTNPVEFDNRIKLRGLTNCAEKINKIDEERRNTQTVLQNILAERNILSKKIGEIKSKKKDATVIIKKVEKLKDQISSLKELEKIKEDELSAILCRIPNLPSKDVPVGDNEKNNTQYKIWGDKPKFTFKTKRHFEIGENLNLMDFDLASKLSGSRFVVLQGMLAKLERAISQFMLDKHTIENGYTEMNVPYLVKDDALFGTGNLPKFGEDLFTAGDSHWLIPTAEVPLTNLVREQIINEKELPMRVTSYTPCFRSEAGAAGKDTRGMLRQHQFTKVELVSITTPEDSKQELERMLSSAESILQDLNIHYRVMTLCTGDMGFAANKTYDIEVWLPGENAYREISSCSNCGDFQARRMNAKYKNENKNDFVHTLNGSGLAVGRTLIAILENYQTADGNVEIPKVLQKYFNGQTTIT
ncbi:MAG: serine--tRNA ligase [Pelagibacteraceae bacterium]|jgi:seryl-tRNA synthetase|nr:serine--tRNA ligase [Pelagibacteraceae bacterium]HJO13254.1 serine--tRNA ligase [Alphaproteobacteria bacterium]MBO6466744.1 serine--tRNA ligase [Pelagibacteraceae bacterium]MBO6467719.1 serine--tRNA ligase [Pelagibacteraceae bacterium]MBO6468583.1 serine--tRNA ligase [Pelagibacteraceae bacterium]